MLINMNVPIKFVDIEKVDIFNILIEYLKISEKLWIILLVWVMCFVFVDIWIQKLQDPIESSPTMNFKTQIKCSEEPIVIISIKSPFDVLVEVNELNESGLILFSALSIHFSSFPPLKLKSLLLTNKFSNITKSNQRRFRAWSRSSEW